MTELMLVMGLTVVVAGIALPVTRHATDGMQLDMAAREVERQLQTARHRSVSTNHALILRLNCPSTGQIRMVEVTGVQATDGDGTRVITHTYYLDSATDQLAHYDGWDTDMPMVDDVVDLNFRYFGDPNPPTSPRPPVGGGNCLFSASGNPRLPTLPSGSGSLVELSEAQLTDGPWCGAVNRFDADLYRIRTVAVELRDASRSGRPQGLGPRTVPPAR